ncbi:MAG TPA: hypothetical protein VJZ71_09660 [Phycisphaerae bacterium]|nr:hypothetical protein [Phycisphaerae bacterium]
MRSLPAILVCFAMPLSGLGLAQWNCAAAAEPAKACCCCPAGTVCQCSCNGPKENPRGPTSPEPVRLICSCGSVPVGMPEGRIHVEPLRLTATIAADDNQFSRTFSSQLTEAWASTHGPPPELANLRTIILLA